MTRHTIARVFSVPFLGMILPSMDSLQSVVKPYLIAYNVVSWLLWAKIAIDLAFVRWLSADARTRAFPHIATQVKVAMTLALAEIAHAAFKFVRSDPATTAMQVLSRLHVIYIVWNLVEETHSYRSSYVVCIAWTLSEIVRYLFYFVQLLTPKVPEALKWLRYSAFIILYPMGILGEMLCMMQALKPFGNDEALQHWPVPMPNKLNFEVSLKFIYQLVLVIYVPGGVHMYTHMLRQRKRALGKTAAKPHFS
eukprot:Gregarina_sp_Pseudo_9__582@NODE_1374_length_1655_cov_87_657797_g1283_i0_p1_GENE_NODE_1374_length_1655_cov_87_657797_g1283_i0NODE_1374_length_1655_cov_87_657797_g1283_i0_p1_ORF_typecomplete_len251_score57_83PTPLA/PF04387_14/9_2e54_NODE_1374_length_1655_cov_87_657797_g1283_i04911243